MDLHGSAPWLYAILATVIISCLVVGIALGSPLTKDKPVESTEDNTNAVDDGVPLEETKTAEPEGSEDVEIVNASADCYQKTEELQECEWTATITGEWDLVFVIPDNPYSESRPTMPSNGTVSGTTWDWTTTDMSQTENHLFVVDTGPDGMDESQYAGTIVTDPSSKDAHVRLDKPCEFEVAESGTWRGGCVESTHDLYAE